ncbi:protein SAWADEE HOMEODOMAIN HOMOLOG 1-like isoform X2 [Malania oleifera]|uniref:protein SAWADEE HOMEODOMAIN HOMOLOG 1-like isoform X2 n=1 Tax=Malania oleifera TaxID=397392 RepID=UPI0025AE21F9|nr:protein SAWADEE HOMEODOMAIN HOMOLOG 1-like isoform X2 [Malania oleifera]
MDRLRPRERKDFSGFTKAEVEKMEKLLRESGEQLLNKEFCQKLAKRFNCSVGRAGKPVVKWIEGRQPDCPSKECSSHDGIKTLAVYPEAHPSNKAHESTEMPKGETVPDLSELEFEARSSKDGAWYDVDTFLAHRFVSSGEPEVRVRFVGFGAEEDEWVNVKAAVRERSQPLEPSECQKIKVGDIVLCFQERRDQAIYYDAHVLEIQRRMHDIRGCRCLFLVRYDHDNSEERVRLRRICCRPTY